MNIKQLVEQDLEGWTYLVTLVSGSFKCSINFGDLVVRQILWAVRLY